MYVAHQLKWGRKPLAVDMTLQWVLCICIFFPVCACMQLYTTMQRYSISMIVYNQPATVSACQNKHMTTSDSCHMATTWDRPFTSTQLLVRSFHTVCIHTHIRWSTVAEASTMTLISMSKCNSVLLNISCGYHPYAYGFLTWYNIAGMTIRQHWHSCSRG